MKVAYGVELGIDEGVIGMVRGELLDMVEIEDILAIFRPVPRVVEVPKFIEKVVSNLVTIPETIVLNQKTASITPISKTEVVQDKYGVPIRHEIPIPVNREVPIKAVDHIEKPLIYTQHHEIPVNQVIERSKAVEYNTEREKIVEVDRAVEIPGEDKILIQKEL